MKIDSTRKIAIAVVATTAVVLAIVLPVTLNQSAEKSNEISGAKENEASVGDDPEFEFDLEPEFQPDILPGSDQTDMNDAETCPCFDLDSLANALSLIAENDRYFYHADKSCTGEKDDGLIFSGLVEGRSGEFSPRAMGYTVGQGYCLDYDVKFSTTSAQDLDCRSLLEEICSDHANLLNPHDNGSEVDHKCPCFDAANLDQAVSDIAGDDIYTYHAGSSCTGKDDTGISYSVQVEGADGKTHPQSMGYAAGQGYCREYDIMHDINSAQSQVCRSLIEEKCSEHANVLNSAASPPVVESTCPCFDEARLDRAVSDIIGDGDFIFNGRGTCTGKLSNGISYSKLAQGKYPVAMGYAIGSGYCRETDMMRVVNPSEEDVCRDLIESKCAQYSEELAEAASANPSN